MAPHLRTATACRIVPFFPGYRGEAWHAVLMLAGYSWPALDMRLHSSSAAADVAAHTLAVARHFVASSLLHLVGRALVGPRGGQRRSRWVVGGPWVEDILTLELLVIGDGVSPVHSRAQALAQDELASHVGR